MKKKIGRNDPCWCGSGKKYKKCHLNRAFETPVMPWETEKATREKCSRKFCSAPSSLHNECSKKISKAHTVPKSQSLKAIANEGHVLGLKFGTKQLEKNNGMFYPERIGINMASTFTGFCQKHDDQLFSCLEKHPFCKSDEQCFKLAYRSFSREYYTKASMVDMYEVHSSLDKGQSLDRQRFVQEYAYIMNQGAKVSQKDNNIQKKFFDHCIETNDFSSIRSFIVEFSETFPVQVSGSVNPDYDFAGKKLQNLLNFENLPDLLSFTSFFDGCHAFIVLSWLKHSHKSCDLLIKSLLEKAEEDLPIYLVQYIFSNFENSFIDPTWWDGLNSADKDIIIGMLNENISPYNEPNGNSISKKLLNVPLPILISKDFINWELGEEYSSQ